ncbi:MBL fold metallo-hydrolase [Paenibacillus caui]|uniref:MBL fold metallo-hydrolase n=1 Tax=Paenibacillus caui TaxID=2873927 RepID=UPI001CA83213|nr:MBL fold metallo-hydrolase [Paenibacillus caui]
MRVIKEGNLYQLTFLPRIFPVNCYFVEEEEGLTLIDAALPYSAKGILQAAFKLGKPIARILLTHAHGDHLGALDTLKQALPDVPVHISRRDSRLLVGDLSLDPGEADTPIKGDVPKPGKIQTKPDILLEDGDQIGSLVTISSPGHTPGSVSFYDKRNGVLIAGDAFQTRSGIAVAGQVRPLFPFPAMATWSKQVSLESARKLEQLKPTLLAVGHGELLKQPGNAINRAIAEAERNLGEYNTVKS